MSQSWSQKQPSKTLSCFHRISLVLLTIMADLCWSGAFKHTMPRGKNISYCLREDTVAVHQAGNGWFTSGSRGLRVRRRPSLAAIRLGNHISLRGEFTFKQKNRRKKLRSWDLNSASHIPPGGNVFQTPPNGGIFEMINEKRKYKQNNQGLLRD